MGCRVIHIGFKFYSLFIFRGGELSRGFSPGPQEVWVLRCLEVEGFGLQDFQVVGGLG